MRYLGKGTKRSILKCLIASLNVCYEFLYDNNFITIEVFFLILYEGGDLGLRNRDFLLSNLASLSLVLVIVSKPHNSILLNDQTTFSL